MDTETKEDRDFTEELVEAMLRMIDEPDEFNTDELEYLIHVGARVEPCVEELVRLFTESRDNATHPDLHSLFSFFVGHLTDVAFINGMLLDMVQQYPTISRLGRVTPYHLYDILLQQREQLDPDYRSQRTILLNRALRKLDADLVIQLIQYGEDPTLKRRAGESISLTDVVLFYAIKDVLERVVELVELVYKGVDEDEALAEQVTLAFTQEFTDTVSSIIYHLCYYNASPPQVENVKELVDEFVFIDEIEDFLDNYPHAFALIMDTVIELANDTVHRVQAEKEEERIRGAIQDLYIAKK